MFVAIVGHGHANARLFAKTSMPKKLPNGCPQNSQKHMANAPCACKWANTKLPVPNTICSSTLNML